MIGAVRKASRGLSRDFGEVQALQVAKKGPADFVTAADLKVENALFEELQKLRPGYSFLGEERGLVEGTDKTHTWIADPIDGTTNFINGLPWFAVSIAWLAAGRTRLAVTYNPISDEMFYAREGNGAYLNGRRLPLRQVTGDIAQCVAGVDFKRIPKPLADRIAIDPPYFSQRNFGCSTLEWCNLAAGRLDLYLHGGQMLWDYAAGSLILREAGGQACTLAQDDFDAADVWRRPVLAALHPRVFATWKDWVRAGC